MLSNFSRVSEWPRGPGLSHGWHGLAWLWLHLRHAERVPARPRTTNAIRAHLLRGSMADPALSSHLMMGTAADAVVAALASRVDSSFAPVAKVVIGRWIASGGRSNRVDLLAGNAGALLAAAEIDAYLPGRLPRRFSRAMHDETLRAIEGVLQLSEHSSVVLGFAHGVTGILFALEASAARFGHPLDDRTRTRALALLSASSFGVPGGQGALWPWASADPAPNAHGWCHGGPGIALGLLGCLVLSRRPEYRASARAALLGICAVVNAQLSTCCGVLGQVQVLIEAHRQLGKKSWYERAVRLHGRTPRGLTVSALPRRGLWKGLPGPAYLSWRIKHPKEVPFIGLGSLSAGSLGVSD